MSRRRRMVVISALEVLETRVCLAHTAFPGRVGAGAGRGLAGLSRPVAAVVRELGVTDPRRDPYLTLSQWMNEMPSTRGVSNPPGVAALRRMWAELWVNTESPGGAWTRPVVTPGAVYRDGTWIWDTGFHVLGLLRGGINARRLARWQIEVILNASRDDGWLPRKLLRSGPDTIGPLGIQAPGILTYAANRLYDAAATRPERAEMRAALAQFYPRLVANDRWFAANLDQGRGLLAWTTQDSGWDNSPRWEQPLREALDLNCWIYLDRLELSMMARTLGRDAEADAWARLAAQTGEIIRQTMWDPAKGMFNDTLADGTVSDRVTPVIVMPLWVGLATPEQARATLAHLTNPSELATRFGLASVAQNDAAFDPSNFWRGPVWININWMAIRAYQRYGFLAEANALRAQTLALVASSAHAYEYYDPRTGRGLGSPDYGWTAALTVDLALSP